MRLRRGRIARLGVFVSSAVALLSACSGGGASVTGQNVYEKLGDAGIYCSNERVDQPMSYIERPDGTTESASPYPWSSADCDTGEYSFTIRMFGSGGDLSDALSDCVIGVEQGFVSRGSNWIGYWGGMTPLDRRSADEISAALGGETLAIRDLCSSADDESASAAPPSPDNSALVDELMVEIGDEGMPEGASECIRTGLSGFSTEELTALRDGETDADVPAALQEKVVSLLTGCITE